MADMAAHTTVSSRRLTVDSPHLAHLLRRSALEGTQGKILTQSPTDATRFWWHLPGLPPGWRGNP